MIRISEFIYMSELVVSVKDAIGLLPSSWTSHWSCLACSGSLLFKNIFIKNISWNISSNSNIYSESLRVTQKYSDCSEIKFFVTLLLRPHVFTVHPLDIARSQANAASIWALRLWSAWPEELRPSKPSFICISRPQTHLWSVFTIFTHCGF